MKAIIINIGDELLTGQVTNFNASWMAEQLNKTGIEVLRINVISDRENEIISALKEAEPLADIILLTGGLGPTNDDITKQTLCKYFNTRLIFNEETYIDITEFFRHRGSEVTEINKMQAEIPEGSKAISNHEGTAPGLWTERNGKIFVAVPGVPFEMKPMMSGIIIPLLEERMCGEFIVHKTVLTQGIAESLLAGMISDWENNLPPDISLAYLPSPGLVRLRLSARGKNKEILKNIIDKQISSLSELIKDNIYGYDSETMEMIVGRLLTDAGKTVVTAESCTGGYISHAITKVQGSSAYFKGSVVAYSNEIKENILGVKHETLVKYGAVSEETVKEMAVNARIKLNADYAVAVSGIAGPDGGTAEKPAGLIWIAIASDDNVLTQNFRFGNNRLVNIERTSVTALNMLRKEILKENNK